MEWFGMREMACMIKLQGDMTCMDAIVVLQYIQWLAVGLYRDTTRSSHITQTPLERHSRLPGTDDPIHSLGLGLSPWLLCW